MGRSAKNAFKLGAATRIYHRIKADNDPLQNPDYQEGLVFLGQSINQARAFTESVLGAGWTTAVSRYSNPAAYAAGYHQGGTVGLNQQMGTGLHLSGQ